VFFLHTGKVIQSLHKYKDFVCVNHQGNNVISFAALGVFTTRTTAKGEEYNVIYKG